MENIMPVAKDKQKEFNKRYINELLYENKIKLLETFKGAKKHHDMECLVCEHQWNATPISKRQNYKKYGKGGCPHCNNVDKEAKYVLTRKANIEVLKCRGIIVLDDWDGRRHIKDENTYTKIKVKNIKCGHIFECSPTNLLTNNVNCPECGKEERMNLLIQWSKNNSKKWRETASEWHLYRKDAHNATHNTYVKYKDKINPKDLPRGLAGVDGAYQLDHIVPVRFCFDNNIPIDVCSDITNLQMCKWEDNLSSKASIKGSLPPLFLQYVESGKRIKELAISLKKEIFPKAKLFYQLDAINITIYDKSANVGIVIIPMDKSFANMKTANLSRKTLKKNGIRHFIIFEDEFNKPFIVNKLRHYIGKSSNNIQRIHGRKCQIQLIDKKDKSKFLNTFHIQGNDAAKISYGAYHEGKLVAVMTFSKPRVLLGYKNPDRRVYNGMWELSRFATNTNYRIPGIASKLLSTFKKETEWKKIISYADKRWSVGNLYDVLGFTMEKSNQPDYFYIIEGKRKHRWNYRKDRLKETLPDYDPNFTEYENMENAGFYRLWDCGTFRYVIYNEEFIHT